MSKYVNSFALLDGEDGDDVDIVVDLIVKKVDDLMHAQSETQSSEFEHNDNDGRKGGRGRRDGSRGNGDGWNGGFQGEDGRNFYGSGDGRVRGQGQGQGGFGGDDWQGVSKSRGKGYGDERRSYRNENQSYDGVRRGHGEQVQGNGAGDGQRRYRNGNQNYGGEKRGYENQGQDYHAVDGQRRYSKERRSNDGERGGYEDQVHDNDANSEQLRRQVNVYEDSKYRDEERKYRNENRNRSGGRRGYGGNRGAGSDYRRTGSVDLNENKNADGEHDVKVDSVNGSGLDAEIFLEPSKAAETEEQNTSEEVTGDIRDPNEETDEQKMKDERKERELKRKEEEEKEAALMTLDQYEKLLLEKRKALEASKTEVRRVSIDKELEGMRLIQKKADASDEERKSEKENLKKDGRLEKKEKNLLSEAEKLRELFKPAYRRSIGGRGQGRSGSGDQGGFRDQTNNGGPRTNGDAAARAPAPTTAPAPAPRRMRIPTARDFPVLGASPSAAVPAAPALEIRSTAPVRRST